MIQLVFELLIFLILFYLTRFLVIQYKTWKYNRDIAAVKKKVKLWAQYSGGMDDHKCKTFCDDMLDPEVKEEVHDSQSD